MTARTRFPLSYPRPVLPCLPVPARPTRLLVKFVVWDLEAADRHRRLDCFCYDRCLDYAVASAWDNWSCRSCPMFEQPTQLAL